MSFHSWTPYTGFLCRAHDFYVANRRIQHQRIRVGWRCEPVMLLLIFSEGHMMQQSSPGARCQMNRRASGGLQYLKNEACSTRQHSSSIQSAQFAWYVINLWVQVDNSSQIWRNSLRAFMKYHVYKQESDVTPINTALKSVWFTKLDQISPLWWPICIGRHGNDAGVSTHAGGVDCQEEEEQRKRKGSETSRHSVTRWVQVLSSSVGRAAVTQRATQTGASALETHTEQSDLNPIQTASVCGLDPSGKNQINPDPERTKVRFGAVVWTFVNEWVCVLEVGLVSLTVSHRVTFYFENKSTGITGDGQETSLVQPPLMASRSATAGATEQTRKFTTNQLPRQHAAVNAGFEQDDLQLQQL